jgi:hypothetical protein
MLKLRVTNALSKSYMYWLIGILITLVAISRTGLTFRFPWEDLYWNDLQLYNSWRWFSETLHDNGLLNLMNSVIDFRQNTGDLFISSPKWPNPILDIGAWFSYIFGNSSLAFFAKFSILALLSGSALYRLIQENPNFQHRGNLFKVSVFSALFASVVLHPILHGEVGPLNQWYLLLIPNWFYVLNKLDTRALQNWHIINPYLCGILLISLGSSDLFFIPTISGLYLIFILRNISSKKLVANFFKQYLFVLTIFLIDKSSFLLESIRTTSQIIGKGSNTPKNYFEGFLVPLFRDTSLVPNFAGPASIFFNSVLIILLIFSLKNRSKAEFHKYFFALILVIVLLSSAGLFAHAVPTIRNVLPSMVRYHLNFFPFALVAILARFANLSIKLPRLTSSVEFPHFFKPLGPVLVAALVFTLNTNNYYGKVIPQSEYVLSTETSKWYMKVLPNCINKNISDANLSAESKSFIFVKRSGSSNYMDDTIVFLSEIPDTLHGRTFQQWRYSTGIFNQNLLVQSGSSGLYTRPFLPENTSDIFKFARATASPFIISTQAIVDHRLHLLGSCQFPNKLKEFVEGNSTLGTDVFLYHFGDIFPDDTPIFWEAKYFSSHASFALNCALIERNSIGTIDLPINYDRHLKAILNGADVGIYGNDLNQLVLDSGSFCKNSQVANLDISSTSKINVLRMILLLFLTLVLPFLFLISRRFRKSS